MTLQSCESRCTERVVTILWWSTSKHWHYFDFVSFITYPGWGKFKLCKNENEDIKVCLFLKKISSIPGVQWTSFCHKQKQTQTEPWNSRHGAGDHSSSSGWTLAQSQSNHTGAQKIPGGPVSRCFAQYFWWDLKKALRLDSWVPYQDYPSRKLKRHTSQKAPGGGVGISAAHTSSLGQLQGRLKLPRVRRQHTSAL